MFMMLAVSSANASVPTSQAELVALPGHIASALVAHDVTTLRAMCTPSAVVVDEFPPNLWAGRDACGRFADDFAKLAKHVHLSSMSARTGTTVVTRSPGRIYVVTRVTLTPVVAGKPMPEDGTWTFVLMPSNEGWKIASMTWGTMS